MSDEVSQNDAATTDAVRALLVGRAGPDEGSLQAQLDALGYTLRLAATPEAALDAVETERPDLIIIDATAPDIDSYEVASHIRRLTREKAVPVMFACLPGDLRAKVESRDLGADDCFAKPIETEVLAARIRLLLRNRRLELSLRRQHHQSSRLNEELIEAREALDRELELASSIQRSLLPTHLPGLSRFQFAAALHPSGIVSGDFYDFYRLDETHYGFYVADAIGHGVPAALLTILVKKGIQTRDVIPDGYRLLPPGDVLERLSHDLMEEKLAGSPFVTLFYATLDVEDGTLMFASGGHPPAMLLRVDGSTLPLLADGALLGVFESDFTTGEVTLTPGDQIVIYTDGIEQARTPSGKTGLDALLEHLKPEDTEPASPAESREAFVKRVETALDVLIPQTPALDRRDDVTVFALRMLS